MVGGGSGFGIETANPVKQELPFGDQGREHFSADAGKAVVVMGLGRRTVDKPTEFGPRWDFRKSRPKVMAQFGLRGAGSRFLPHR